MCLALLPLLGPFTQEKPRRPNGGPDGARDLEAIYQRSTVVWGAVGFRNGGGSDRASRRYIEKKFTSDLNQALEENPELEAFVFFTNVDLEPSKVDNCKNIAKSRNVKFVDIFDFARLRHVLDSPEGLLARLQYLDIPMSPSEQASLVAKFGSQLQSAVTARFDRVEQTLAQMENFLAFQRPIQRIDLFFRMTTNENSLALGQQAILVAISGLIAPHRQLHILCRNHLDHSQAGRSTVFWPTGWTSEPGVMNSVKYGKPIGMTPTIESRPKIISCCSELMLSKLGHKVKISDLDILSLEVCCTEGMHEKIEKVSVNLNGFSFFDVDASVDLQTASLAFPPWAPVDLISRKWFILISKIDRNIMFDIPEPSSQFGRLIKFE